MNRPKRSRSTETSPGYGVTSADSALVLEGLLHAGVATETLVVSLDALRDRYFEPDSGGFSTVANGRAAYWAGPSSDTTALVAWLMQRVAPERYERELDGAERYLLAQQEVHGGWRARWFSSRVFASSYALRFLAARDASHAARDQALARGRRFLLALQRSDGSFAGSVSESAHALQALHVLSPGAPAERAATRWLRQQVARGVPAGDGFLHYWFEDAQGGRTMLTCKDRGQLAKALAERAL